MPEEAVKAQASTPSATPPTSLVMKFLFDHDVPDDLAYALLHLGHEVVFLRNVLPRTINDEQVFHYAKANALVLVSCNRNDFLPFATKTPHSGIIILIRRKTRSLERAALMSLITKAGMGGLANNLNFA